MGTRNIQEWFKLAFRLLVSEKWEVISERVENGDPTYRWLREILILKLRSIERNAWETTLAASAFNIKERIVALRGYVISEEMFISAQHYVREDLFAVRDSSRLTASQRVLAARLALLARLLKYHDNDVFAGRAICNLFSVLTDDDEVVNAIYGDKNDPKLAYEVKEMYDMAKEYAALMKIPIDDLFELEFEEDCLPKEHPVEPYTPPEIWVFGEFGDQEGRLSSPDKVQIDKEGNYLVLDQDISGASTHQRLQLFNPLGKLIKVILTRGEGKVNGMTDFCLDKNGNIIVCDTDDDNNRERIQVFDYDTNQLLLIEIDKDDPDGYTRILSVFNDEEGNIITTDMGCYCIRVFGPDGKVKSRFGKQGRDDNSFMGLRSAYAKDNKIYVYNHGIDVLNNDVVVTVTKVFDYDGNFIDSIWNGYSYKQLVFHTDGKMYTVTDREIHRIDLDGNKEVVAKSTDDGLEHFHVITSMAFHPDGRIVVSDAGINNRIKVFKI